MSWAVAISARAGDLELRAELSGNTGPLALIGPNGSGKTTLLRVLAGAHRPTAGTIEIGSTKVFDAEHGIDVPSERRGIGYVPQGYGLFPHLRVIDNVAFGLSTGPRRRRRSERRDIAHAVLEELECSHLAERFPHGLSGGEQQRVALARALVIEPSLLLLDEPLAALDATARRSVREFLARRLRSLDCPSIVVTHDIRDVITLDAEVCVLEQGLVVQKGVLATLREAPATDFVSEFVAPALPLG
jgi:ABC-type sulfate/molybdate transport systems ATPase subunit